MEAVAEFFAELLLIPFEGMINGGGATPEDLKMSTNLLTFSNAIWHYVAILAFGMTLVYFLYEMNQKLALEGRDLNIKSIMSPFLKLGIAIILLLYSDSIISSILGFHNNFIEWSQQLKIEGGANGITVSETGGVAEIWFSEELNETQIEEIKQKTLYQIKTLGIFQMFMMFLPAFIMFLLNLVLTLIWKYKALTYKLEVLWKIGVTPLAMADIYNGSHSNAIRWIKGLIATAIYGGSFILLVKLGSAVSISGYFDAFNNMIDASASGDGSGFLANFVHQMESWLSFMVMPFAELGVLGAVKQATKEALG